MNSTITGRQRKKKESNRSGDTCQSNQHYFSSVVSMIQGRSLKYSVSRKIKNSGHIGCLFYGFPQTAYTAGTLSETGPAQGQDKRDIR